MHKKWQKKHFFFKKCLEYKHFLLSLHSEMKNYDYLIVGAGLSGAMESFVLHKQGYRCLVAEKSRIGGMCYTDVEDGIVVHRNGAHIFHTNDKRVWDFVNSIVPFVPYVNSPMACYGKELYNLPFNMNTFMQLFGTKVPYSAYLRIEQERTHYENPKNLEEQALNLVGVTIYEKLIKGYTEKQWGHKCTELPPEIIKRIPLRFTFDNNYFNDTYQGIPVNGYTEFIERLLKISGAELLCGATITKKEIDDDIRHSLKEGVIYTGRIDEYFDYCLGSLEYRSVKFRHDKKEIDNFQGCAVMNFTSANVPFTRRIEHKHFMRDCKNDTSTIVSSEYPSNEGEPCYPVNDKKNMALYAKYKELADKEEGVKFVGRLAEYKYYDMNKIVEKYIDLL